jgi:rhomboid protease GluP
VSTRLRWGAVSRPARRLHEPDGLCHAAKMREGEVLVRGGLDDGEAQRVVVLLASMGIESVVDYDAFRRLGVYVAQGDADSARRLVAEELATTSEVEARPRYEEIPAPKAWFGRGSAAVLGVGAVCVVVFALAMQGDAAGTRARWLELGAIERLRVASGEYWRLLTAVFLHFDASHLLGNMSVLLFVGPPLAHWLGPWRFLLVFVACGIGGNVASFFLAATGGLKAGASGAIAGVLGALGGQSLRPERSRRRKAWQTLGALAALYGLLVGFGPRADHVAHGAGLLVGIAMGWSFRPSR